MQKPIFFPVMLILFICQGALANTTTPYSSIDEKRRAFSIINGKYEDTRIDYNQDKKIDYWKIKRDGLTLEAYYLPSKIYVHIRKFDKLFVYERLVLIQGKKAKLLAVNNRRQHIYNYSRSEIECSNKEIKTLADMLNDLKKTTVNVELCTKNSLAKNCYEVTNGEFIDFIDQAVQNVFQAPSTSPQVTNKALSCFQDERVKSVFQEKFGKDNGQLEYEKALIGVKNSILKFSNMSEKNSEPFLQCRQTEESDPIPPMKTSEGGLVIINVKKEGASYDLKSLESQLFHENLHRSSVSDEALARKITSLCYSNSPTEYKFVHDSGANSQLTQTILPAVVGGNLAQAEKNAVAIPATVEIPLPPPASASPVEMNRVASVESFEKVQSISNSQTSGIVRMAEGVLAATPAVASTGTLAKGTSTGSSGSRLPASDYSNSQSASKVKNPAAELLAKNRSGGLKPGEYIKEEIDLTKQLGTTSTRSAANAGSKAATAAADRNSKTAAPVQPADESVEFAGSAAGGGSGRSSSASLSPSSGGGGQRRPQQRGTAAMGSASAQPVYGSAREEVVSVLSTNSYREAQRSLKDKNFLNKLQESKVTVYDFNGNTYGATKGEIVFVDQGDRFVREK